MFAITNPGRRSSTILGGVLLAALFSAADLADPTVASAQTSAAHRVLLGQFDPGFGIATGGSAGSVATSDARATSGERALLGKVEPAPAEKQGQDATGRRASLGLVGPRAGEQALLGRRGGVVS